MHLKIVYAISYLLSNKKNPKRGKYVFRYCWFNKYENQPLVFVTGSSLHNRLQNVTVRLRLSVVIKVRFLTMFCFYSFFSSTPSLSSAWLPLYMLSMSDPAVTTNYLEGLQASLLILTTALFLLKA